MISIPEDVRNINTVQDSAARLRELLELFNGQENRMVVEAQRNLQQWIDHARRSR